MFVAMCVMGGIIIGVLSGAFLPSPQDYIVTAVVSLLWGTVIFLWKERKDERCK